MSNSLQLAYKIKLEYHGSPGLTHTLVSMMTNNIRSNRQLAEKCRFSPDGKTIAVYLEPTIGTAYLSSLLDRIISKKHFGCKYEIESARGEEPSSAVNSELETLRDTVNRLRDDLQRAGQENRENGIQVVELGSKVERLIGEKSAVEKQVEATERAYRGRLETQGESLKAAERRIVELSKGVAPEVLVAKYLFDPGMLIQTSLQIMYSNLMELVPQFEEFREKSLETAFKEAAKESDIHNMTFIQYRALSHLGIVHWEKTDKYKGLKPKYDEAVEGLELLRQLKAGVVPQGIAKVLVPSLIDTYEGKDRAYQSTIVEFQREEGQHRRITALFNRVQDLFSQSPTEQLLEPPQRVVYIATISPQGSPELHVPLKDEVASTYLGSLLMQQLDQLGERLPSEVFYRYGIGANRVLATQHKFDFYKLGLRLAVVSLMEHAPQQPTREKADEVTMVEGLTARQRVILSILEKNPQGLGTDKLANMLDISRTWLYQQISPLIERSLVEKTKEGKKVRFTKSG